MIKHIVMFRFKEECKGSLPEAVEKAKALGGLVPSLRNISVVTNAEGADGTNYDIALICDFDDMNGLNEYQVHPEHKKFGGFISPLRTENGRACIDFEV